jgi:hypothetical protein
MYEGAMLNETNPRGSKTAGKEADREKAIRKITHLADIEKSFDEMCVDLASATHEVSRLTEVAKESVARLDTSLRAFRQSVERMNAVDPGAASGHLATIERNIEAFEAELANLDARFGRFRPSLDETQAAIESAIRSVVSDAEENIEAEVRWMKHSLRKKLSEQSLYTNKNIELSSQRVTDKVKESRDYIRNLLYLVLILLLGSIAAQIYFAFNG